MTRLNMEKRRRYIFFKAKGCLCSAMFLYFLRNLLLIKAPAMTRVSVKKRRRYVFFKANRSLCSAVFLYFLRNLLLIKAPAMTRVSVKKRRRYVFFKANRSLCSAVFLYFRETVRKKFQRCGFLRSSEVPFGRLMHFLQEQNISS